MGPNAMQRIADFIDRVLTRRDDVTIAAVHREVEGLAAAHPLYGQGVAA
jgi:glycine/serine hydroxymethyltransferase